MKTKLKRISNGKAILDGYTKRRCKLKAQVKRDWLAALRGGEYKQVKSTLCATKDGEDRFCCLGVMGDLDVRNGLADWSQTVNGGVNRLVPYASPYSERPMTAYGGAGVPVFQQLDRWFTAGRHASPGHRVEAINEVIGKLANANDGGATFDEIADFIEEKL